MDLTKVTQNFTRLKKCETINEITSNLNSMDGIEACSCEGLSPQK